MIVDSALYNLSGSKSGALTTIYIENTLNPSYYLENGRSMIFSEADMAVKGYSYKDLTDVERRMQAVLEKTYTDWLYLINITTKILKNMLNLLAINIPSVM